MIMRNAVITTDKRRLGCHGDVVLMLDALRYHVLLELLPGGLRETPGGLGGGQLGLRPPQPLQELL